VWYYTDAHGSQYGPVAAYQLHEWRRAGMLDERACLVWRAGIERWVPLKDLHEHMALSSGAADDELLDAMEQKLQMVHELRQTRRESATLAAGMHEAWGADDESSSDESDDGREAGASGATLPRHRCHSAPLHRSTSSSGRVEGSCSHDLTSSRV